MAESETRECTDCQGTMSEIKLIDKEGTGGHATVEYTNLDAKRAGFFRRYSVEGAVKSFMCGDCGLIKLYGAPKS